MLGAPPVSGRGSSWLGGEYLRSPWHPHHLMWMPAVWNLVDTGKGRTVILLDHSSIIGGGAPMVVGRSGSEAI